MAKLLKEWLSDNAVDETKLKLSNNAFLKGRNQANTSDVDILKVNASNIIELAQHALTPASAPTTDYQVSNKKYVDDGLGAKLNSSEVGTSVCPLVAGKVPMANLPSPIMTYEGTWNATTNSPILADGGGDIGQVYKVSVGGTIDLGSGSITFLTGDQVIYNSSGVWERSPSNTGVSSINGQLGDVTLDTDDISEGATNKYYSSTLFNASLATKTTDNLSEGSINLYFTEGRAQTAAVINATSGSETVQAASVSAMKAYVAAQLGSFVGADAKTEVKTLISQDITNQYIDLAFVAMTDSVHVCPVGGIPQTPTDDYTISYTGGVAGVTRITFAGDLASTLIAGHKLVLKYLKA